MASVEKEVVELWWTIYGSCFSGTNFNRKNALFMSTGNNSPSGSIFTLEKNILSRIVDKSLIWSYADLLKEFSDYPVKSNAAISVPPCISEYSFANTTAIEVYGKLLDGTNIGNINAELLTILKKSKNLKIKISKWGYDVLSEGKYKRFFENKLSSKNRIITDIADGYHYLATEGIWIEGMVFTYELDKDAVQRIAVIYEQNKAKFLEVGVKIDISSQTSLSTAFEYKDKFYPFLKFGKITVTGSIKKKDTDLIVIHDLDIFDDAE